MDGLSRPGPAAVAASRVRAAVALLAQPELKQVEAAAGELRAAVESLAGAVGEGRAGQWPADEVEQLQVELARAGGLVELGHAMFGAPPEAGPRAGLIEAEG